MARIRTIKPEFWQHEGLASCSPHARLLAIAVLQLADVAGRFRWIPMQVHAHAFPFEDELNIGALADELEAIGYLQRYEVGGKKYALVPGFVEHQRITGKEAASASQHPEPPSVPHETKGNHPEANGESTGCVPEKQLGAQEREREEEQGKGREESPQPAAAGGPVGPPPCPHQEIIDLYHEILPELPRVRIWNDQRKRHLQARWREDPERQDPDWWRRFFTYVHRTQGFLLGQNDRGWKADLEWIVTAGNFAKIIEGARYRAREPA